MTSGLKSRGWFRIIAGVMLFVSAVLAANVALAQASGKPAGDNGTQVLEQFDRAQAQRVQGASEISDHEKQVIMFAMGIPLVLLLFATGALGVATGVYGKQLFIPHMVVAGLTMTLAVAHVIVGLVWFYPF